MREHGQKATPFILLFFFIVLFLTCITLIALFRKKISYARALHLVALPLLYYQIQQNDRPRVQSTVEKKIGL